MSVCYDFHLHSCLSPCADGEMTPCNLVNMAALLGYGVIALTDHNTAGNCQAAVLAGERAGITVVPGMELCTAEEIHMVCLFPGLESAAVFEKEVRATLPDIPNKPAVFGHQVYRDEADHAVGEEQTLLVTASGISIEEAPAMVQALGGFCYPAHIDRMSFSVLSSLGMIPPELGFTSYELSRGADASRLKAEHSILDGMTVLYGSDAHSLEDMQGCSKTLDLQDSPTAQQVLDVLRGLRCGC